MSGAQEPRDDTMNRNRIRNPIRRRRDIPRLAALLSIVVIVALCIAFWWVYLTFAPIRYVDSCLFMEDGRLPQWVDATEWRIEPAPAEDTPAQKLAYRRGTIDTLFFSISFVQTKEPETGIIRLVRDKTTTKRLRVVGVSALSLMLWFVFVGVVYHRRRMTRSD